MDILQWLIGKKCKKVQSFGALSYFKEENAPKDAPDYCIQGCPKADTCPYNAVRLYLDDKENDWFRTTSTREANPTDEMVETALRTTQYGKCVFKCDNDVVDHQTVNMIFEDDITVTFTMNAFNKGGRFIHIMGTKGELHAAMDGLGTPITIYEFETKQTTEIPIVAKDGITNGHGGGDDGIVYSLYEYLTGEYQGFSVSDIRTSVNESPDRVCSRGIKSKRDRCRFRHFCRESALIFTIYQINDNYMEEYIMKKPVLVIMAAGMGSQLWRSEADRSS